MFAIPGMPAGHSHILPQAQDVLPDEHKIQVLQVPLVRRQSINSSVFIMCVFIELWLLNPALKLI